MSPEIRKLISAGLPRAQARKRLRASLKVYARDGTDDNYNNFLLAYRGVSEDWTVPVCRAGAISDRLLGEE